MPPRSNILTFIAALVVSAQAMPPNIGRGSFVYDPNSILQNEKILRLFLRLASHTANRLIHLKNEAKLQQSSTPDGETIVPEVRIELPDDYPRQTIGRRQLGYHERPRYSYEHASLKEPFSDRAKGPYQTAYYDEFDKKGPYMPGPLDEVEDYRRKRGQYTPRRRSNDENPVGEKKFNDKPSLHDSVMLPLVSDKSFGNNAPSIKSQEKLEKSTQDIGTEVPVEIERRMLFNVEKNNYVTHYNDNSRNVNNADTRINNIASANQQGTGIPQSGQVIVNQNAGSSGSHGNKSGSNVNQAKTEINNIGSGSSGPVVIAENAGSMLASQSSGGSARKFGSASSSVQSRSSESTQQTKSASSHRQSGSLGVESVAQEMKSAISNAGGSGIGHQAMSATSSLQSGSSGMLNAVQGLASGVQSSAAGAELSGQGLTGASKFQSGMKEQLSAVQHAGSKVLIGTMATANENQANQMMTETALAKNQRDESSESHGLFGMLDRNKSGGILSNGNPATGDLLNQGSSLANSSHAMSSISNVGSGTMSKFKHAAQMTGSKVVQGIEKPVTSMAQDSAGKVGKHLGDLTGMGSKLTGSVVLESGSGSRTAFETNIRRGSAAAALMRSSGDGVSQVGSSLIGSVPLFRSFPDIYDDSSTLKKIVLNTTHSKNNSTEVIDGQTALNQPTANNQGILTMKNKTSAASENLKSRNTSTRSQLPVLVNKYANNEKVSEDRVSELELEEYASQFADALRPLESIRGRSR